MDDIKIDGWTAGEQLIEAGANMLESAEHDSPDGVRAARDAYALTVLGIRAAYNQAVADGDFDSLATLTATLIQMIANMGKLLE